MPGAASSADRVSSGMLPPSCESPHVYHRPFVVTAAKAPPVTTSRAMPGAASSAARGSSGMLPPLAESPHVYHRPPVVTAAKA
jgi:hypothetical protein